MKQLLFLCVVAFALIGKWFYVHFQSIQTLNVPPLLSSCGWKTCIFCINFGLNVLFSGATKADLDAENTATIDIDLGATKEGSRTGMYFF